MAVPVVLVHLRQPTNQEDLRDDPFWEYGSFGCTGCHAKNLLHIDHSENLKGKRLAFVQGGRDGMRLLFLSPPITKVDIYKVSERSEVQWSPASMPFKYAQAPLLISRSGKTEGFKKLRKLISKVDANSWKQKLSFKFRSQTKPLKDSIAEELTKIYESRYLKHPDAIANHYSEALPKQSLAREKANRRERYEVNQAEAQRAKGGPRCLPKRNRGC
jgi:hypothetical protein